MLEKCNRERRPSISTPGFNDEAIITRRNTNETIMIWSGSNFHDLLYLLENPGCFFAMTLKFRPVYALIIQA